MLNHVKSIEHFPEGFELGSGSVLAELDISYETFGLLNEDRSNTTLVLHALTGWSNPTEWWSGLVGEGKTIDYRERFIVCPNYLGSCYGTSGPESFDPATDAVYAHTFARFTIADIARVNWMLLDRLNIGQIELGIGGSMGGMVLLEMALQQPNRFKQLVVISATGSHSAWRIGFSSIVLKTIAAFDPTLRDREALQRGLQLARQIGTISYRAASEFDSRFGREARENKFEVEHYLEHQGDSIVSRFSPYSYLLLTDAMCKYDLGESRDVASTAQSVTADVTFVGISDDVLYSISEIEEFSRQFPRSRYLTLEAAHGHDSFLVDAEQLGELLEPFLQSQSITELEAAL